MTINQFANDHLANGDVKASRLPKALRYSFSFSFLAILAAVMALSGCGGGTSAAGDSFPRLTVATISAQPTTANMTVGSTEQLQATAKDQNGNVCRE